ncbi:MAG: DNA-binding response regulator [Bacteroidetes bacterium]|nr:MAG: DNA-binding response regulator [Bacteroidota bacterium]RLD49001.1 MAG: DNA-binding response regulator [Bacteroidota bacterium]RLD74313.1 MAG: DNA-binding response regulator [Bacteroidota bacterium]RLD87609.1 MAG: DNA-binding response regulator [Bacteroidota bacterium]
MIKVSIIEDHHDFRQGLAYLVKASEGFECVDTFVSAEDGIDGLTGDEDVLLLDINLPNLSGIEAIPLIREKFPKLKIIMLTVFDDDMNIMNAILAGADGYLLKKTAPPQILNSLKTCMAGGSPMTPGIAKKVLNLFKKHIPVKNDDFSLTQRETEVLNLLVDGWENQAIADKLFISVQTVRNHIRHIYDKLQVHSKSQAVVMAIRKGLV